MRAHIPIPRLLSVSVPSCISHWELPRAAMSSPQPVHMVPRPAPPAPKLSWDWLSRFSLHSTLPSLLFECISQKCSPVSLMCAKIHPRVSQGTYSKTPSFWQFFAKNWHLFSTKKNHLRTSGSFLRLEISQRNGPSSCGSWLSRLLLAQKVPGSFGDCCGHLQC